MFQMLEKLVEEKVKKLILFPLKKLIFQMLNKIFFLLKKNINISDTQQNIFLLKKLFMFQILDKLAEEKRDFQRMSSHHWGTPLSVGFAHLRLPPLTPASSPKSPDEDCFQEAESFPTNKRTGIDAFAIRWVG